MAIDPNGNAWYDWLLGAVSLVAGIALCFVPGGQVFGAGLIVNGVSSLVSCSLQAAGVDNKITSIITSGLSIVSGIALCCIGLGSIGAGMIGQGIGSIAGGFISEACGGSFALGAAIGGFAGSIIGGFAYRGIQNFRLNRMTPYQKGVMGEKYVQRVTGMKAHTENTGRLRPDFIDRDRSILIDAKNVSKQGLTNQLRSYKGIGMNKTVVYVRLHTKVSTALKNSGIIIKYFPW